MLYIVTTLIFCGGFFAFSSASEEAWRSNCDILNNPAISPFLYLMQSELAVIATYTNIDSNRFMRKDFLDIIIQPLCFVKGFTTKSYLEVESGSQKCVMTPLDVTYQFASLFFLKSKPYSEKFILLNSGEFFHRPLHQGIAFGIGPVGKEFLKTCGVSRTRNLLDKKTCPTACQNYCSYNPAPADKCVDASVTLAKFIPKSEIPAPVPPLGSGAPSNQGNTGQGGGSYESKPKNGTRTVVEKTNSGDGGGGRGGSAALQRSSGLLLLSVLCLLR